MIDIHSHIIFDVDDGPNTLEESLELIDYSYKTGTRTIIATSHRRKGMFEESEDKIKKNFQIIKNIVEKKYKDLSLYYGAEIYYSLDALGKIENNIFPTIATTDYILIEFSPNVSKRDLFKAIDSINILGLKPIVAHIERYDIADDLEIVDSLLNRGAYIQVNASSTLKIKIFGDKEKKYKKRVKNLLKNNCVHFIASDMHNMNSRQNYLKEAYENISNLYGENLAQKLIKDNPKKILNNMLI